MAVPGAIPVMTPVVGLIVATVKLEETQLPPGVVDEKVVVDPTQAVWVPESVPATGALTTVIPLVKGAVVQVAVNV